MAVLVEEPFRCTFVHIPKTGGNSITEWLKNNFSVWITKSKQHSTLPQAEQIYNKPTGLSYCVVRNPWDYAVSWYTFKIYLCEAYIKDVRENPSLENSKPKYNITQQKQMLEKLKNQGFEGWVKQCDRSHQWKWAKDCDYIMKLENIEDDFKFIQQKLNCFEPLGYSNKTPNRDKDYISYYPNQQTIDIVSKKFLKDIEAFGYRFGD